MPQFALPLTLAPVFSADNFFIAPANETAHRAVTNWPKWPAHGLIIYGEKGTGKSHLAHIWRQQSEAVTIEASHYQEFAPFTGNMLVENIEHAANEQALFHLFNHAKESSLFVLFTSSVAPAQLKFALPDLKSRILSIPAEPLSAPDDGMLAAALRKQFSDRQMKVDEEVIMYLIPRIERSLAQVQALADMLDTAALEHKRGLTIPFVKQLLEQH